MRRRHLIVVAGTIAAAVLVAALFRQALPEGANSKSVPVSSGQAQKGKSARYASGASVREALPQLPNPLSNLVPDVFASPAKKMQRLTALGDPFAAQLQAVRSGDPLLIAHSVYLTLHCIDVPVQLQGKTVREMVSESSYDPKTGKKIPPNEALIAMNEAAQSVGPQRIQPPAEFVAELMRQNETWMPDAQPNYARQAEILKRSAASLSLAQRANWTAVVERSASECRGRLIGAGFGAEYRAALGRLVADGVVSAQLFNRRAGWQSESLGQLNDRDYGLMQRALTEWQPDGITRMLVGGSAAVGSFDYAGFSEADFGAALTLEFSLGPLAACALSVSDCGPDSSRFRSLCHSFGGCDEPDMAALLRHVFERDGLDPTLIDREINRVVNAYLARDLDALGIRRATEKKNP